MRTDLWQDLWRAQHWRIPVVLGVLTAPPGWVLVGPVGVMAALAACLAVAVGAALRRSRHGLCARLAEARAGNALALRADLLADLASCLQHAHGVHTGVLVVRLDGAAQISRLLDPLAFEELINLVGMRLKAATRAAGGVARLDSASWGVLVAPAHGQDVAALLRIAARVQHTVAAPLSVVDLSLRPSVSVGLCDAGSSHGGGWAETMLEAAATAADSALSDGPSAVRHISDLPARAWQAPPRARDDEIRAALDSGAIHAVFQPQICARTGAVTGLEALVRWAQEDAVVPPDAFLPALHRLGLSDALTRRMLAQALDALAQIDEAGLSVPGIAINLSAEELRCDTLADTVIWDLECRGIAPERLVVEILESVVADQYEAVMIRNVEALARAGCGIDLDDFGTGHASIANIRGFAVDRLKIDRSFIRGIDADPEQQRLVCAILSMAQELSLGTIAEGIETEPEAAMLRSLGCPVLQGYSFARPMALDALLGWLRAHAAQQPQSGAVLPGHPPADATAPGAVTMRAHPVDNAAGKRPDVGRTAASGTRP